VVLPGDIAGLPINGGIVVNSEMGEPKLTDEGF